MFLVKELKLSDHGSGGGRVIAGPAERFFCHVPIITKWMKAV
jgi:hypothetical protein